MGLVGLKDDYAHDGRVLFEVLDDRAVLRGQPADKEILTRLAQAYKDINAPVGRLGRKTFAISTAALNGDDATYGKLEAKLAQLTDTRNAIAQKMIDILEGSAFDGKAVNKLQAELLIVQAQALVDSVH